MESVRALLVPWTSRSSNIDSTGVMLHRMCRAFLDLVCPFTSIRSQDLAGVKAIPLVISGLKVKLPDDAGQDHSQFGHHEPLRDTIPGPNLKGPISTFHRVKLVSRLDQPSLREELVGPIPVGGCAVQFGMDCEHHSIFGQAAVALIVDQGGIWFAFAAGASGGEEAQGLFDDGGGVRQSIGEMGLLLQRGWHCRQVGPKDLIVFSADLSQGVGVCCQKVKDVADRATGRVVANEHEKTNLADGKRAEFRVELFRPCFSVLGEIGLQYQVNDCFGAFAFGIGFVFVISLVEFITNVLVHLSTIPPVDGPACKVQVLQRIRFSIGLMPPDLTHHTVRQGVVARLSPQGCIPARILVLA